MSTGDLTLLLTDVEGSTRLMERDPDVARTLLAEHDELVADHTTRHGGMFVRNRSEGDSAFLVFREPAAALGCAIGLQRALADRSPDAGPPLRVRMGLHRGRPHRRGTQLYGPVVNRCAAVRNLGHGGQVLLSSVVASAVASQVPGVELLDLGEHRLKDLNDRERIHQACAADLPSTFPPLRSPDQQLHNLVRPSGAYIEGQLSVADIVGHLDHSALVTLVAPGGMGKTRLATEVAWVAREHRRDGAWFADLTGRADEDRVADAIAAAIGVREQPGRRLAETLAEHVGVRDLLLVLDGCEPGAAIGPLVSVLLRGPQVRVLATSAAALGVSGERVVPVPALGVVARSADPLDAPAVRLFLARQRGTRRPADALTPDDLAVAAAICARLEGIPLAVEIAGARAAATSVQRVRAELEDAMVASAGGDAGLRAALESSFAGLDADEAVLFRRMGVFVGGFTLEAAEGVCAVDELAEDAVLDAVGGLVERSLLSADGTAGGMRYRSLQAVRQFAVQQLDQVGESAAFAERHHRWFGALAAECNPELRTGPAAADALEADHDNLQVLLAPRDDGPVDDQLWIASQLVDFWQLRGHWTLGLRVLEDLLARPADLHHPRAVGASGAARLAMFLGVYDLADRHLETAAAERAALVRSLEEQARAPDADTADLARRIRTVQHETMRVALDHSDLARLRGDLRRAEELARGALGTARALEADAEVDACLGQLGTIAASQGDLVAATELMTESVARCAPRGDAVATAMLLNNLGAVAWMRGDLETARLRYTESLQLRQELGDRAGIAEALHNLADVDLAQGIDGRAVGREALDISRELGHTLGVAQALRLLGELTMAAGDLDAAAADLDEAAEAMTAVGDELGLASVRLRQARLDRRTAHLEQARERAGAARSAHAAAGDQAGVAAACCELALIAHAEGSAGEARAWAAAAVRTPSGIGPLDIDIVDMVAIVVEQSDPTLARRLRSAATTWRREHGVPMAAGSDAGSPMTLAEALSVAADALRG